MSTGSSVVDTAKLLSFSLSAATLELALEHSMMTDDDGTVPESLRERDRELLGRFWFTLLPAKGSHRATGSRA
jgi:hypothetical protein